MDAILRVVCGSNNLYFVQHFNSVATLNLRLHFTKVVFKSTALSWSWVFIWLYGKFRYLFFSMQSRFFDFGVTMYLGSSFIGSTRISLVGFYISTVLTLNDRVS